VVGVTRAGVTTSGMRELLYNNFTEGLIKGFTWHNMTRTRTRLDKCYKRSYLAQL